MIVEIADRLKTIQEYYFSRKLKEVAGLQAQGKSIINLGIGKPDLVPSAQVIQRLHQASEDPLAHGYQSYKGIPALRKAMAAFYGQHFNVSLDPEQEILPLMGSKEGIMHISMAFLNPSDEVLIPNPGYPSYAGAAKLAGAKVLSYDLNEERKYQLDLDQLDQLCTEKTKLIWVNDPHMPTGVKADRAIMQDLIFWAKARQILIASDAPYAFILNDQPSSIMSLKGAKEQCIELNSLSKSHAMSGWRVGMAISNAAIIEAVLRFKSNMDSGMFRPVQEAAIQALELESNWYRANNEIYAKRRATLWNMLDKMKFEYDKNTAGLFVWSRINEDFLDGEAASDYFLDKAGVFVPPGLIFGSNGKKFVRWSLCQKIEIIDQAAERIMKVM